MSGFFAPSAFAEGYNSEDELLKLLQAEEERKILEPVLTTGQQAAIPNMNQQTANLVSDAFSNLWSMGENLVKNKPISAILGQYHANTISEEMAQKNYGTSKADLKNQAFEFATEQSQKYQDVRSQYPKGNTATYDSFFEKNFAPLIPDWLTGIMEDPATQLGVEYGSAGAAATLAPIRAALRSLPDGPEPQMPKNSQTGAILWHGTGSKWDEIDPSFQGTGEGPAAFGWGSLYKTDQEELGTQYAKNVSRRQEMRNPLAYNGEPIDFKDFEVDEIRPEGLVGKERVEWEKDRFIRMMGNDANRTRLGPDFHPKRAIENLRVFSELDHKNQSEWVRDFADEVNLRQEYIDRFDKGEYIDPHMIEGYKRNMPRMRERLASSQESIEDIKYRLDALDQIDSSGFGRAKVDPQLYRIEVPDETLNEYIDWFEPLKDQPKAVDRIMDAFSERDLQQIVWGGEVDGPEWGDSIAQELRAELEEMSGKDFYKHTANEIGHGRVDLDLEEYMTEGLTGPKAASLALRDSGIPGIQYAAGGQRVPGIENPKKNYVTFDPETMNPLSRTDLGEKVSYPLDWGKETGAINMFDAADFTPERFKTVSTRIPSETAQRNQGIDAHITDALLVNAGLLSPEKFEQGVGLMRQHPAFRNLSDDPQDAFGVMKDTMAGNLQWMYDIMPEKWRDKAQDWYLGYNRMAQQAARDHGTSNEQAAAVMAVFSPNTEWNLNLTRADRLMDTYNNHQNTPWTPEMTDIAADLEGRVSGRFKDATKSIVGRKLSELETPAEKAMWIRSYDMAHNPREFYLYEPDGSRGKLATKKDGNPKMANWVYNGHAEKAIKILEDGSMENISRQLGGEHKVRSFFHNAADPWNQDTTTVDTHAVAGDMLLPMGSSTGTKWTELFNKPVTQNFGAGMSDASTGMRGTYPFHQAVFNQAAKETGIPSRQMQSPTWDFGRLLFEGQKTKSKQEIASDIWGRVGDGEITAQQARDMIIEAFGMPASPYR